MSDVIVNNLIVLVEDDEKMAQLLKCYFERFDFAVNVLHSGEKASEFILEHKPAIAIIDLHLPGKNGLSICREVRDKFSGQILILTATGDDMDQVAALEMGADDFVSKPIQPRVLLARVRMLIRRNEQNIQTKCQDESASEVTQKNENVLIFGKLWIHKILQKCTLDNELIPLTPSEFSILWCLASQAETTLSRDELLKSISGLEYDGLNRTVDNKVAQLRKKLRDDANRPKGIITVRSQGYVFFPDFW